MNKKFDVISMVLIIVLTFVLIGFIFNYFTKSDSEELSPVNSTVISSNVVENMSGSNTVIISNPVIDENDKNPESTSTIINSESDSGEKLHSDSGDSIIKDVYTKPVEQPKKEPTVAPVIISNDNVSDKEKKEVLKELDETLMDLLDVIENVQTVDESRLPSEESEVQP
jgi:hypothetical protein